MKVLIFSTVLLLATIAHARPDSLSITCDEAKSLVATQGAVIIGTGPDLYDRYVNHAGYCAVAEVAEPAWLKTSDSTQCFVGYTCQRDFGTNR